MSFKRDESDPGPLRALQRRRVAELLASAIPEDEALLLRDGRVACSLCPQRPVCDTLQTLLLHRAGRKHLDSLQRSYGRPRWPQVGPQVTPQEAPGAQAPLLARTRRLAQSALLGATAGDSDSDSGHTPRKGSSSRAGTIPKICRKLPEPSWNTGKSGNSWNSGNPGNSETPGPKHREGVPKERKRRRKGNSRIPEGNNSRIPEGNNSRIPEGNSRIPGGNNSRIPGGNNSRIPGGNSRIPEGNNSRIPEEGPSPERLRILRHHLHLRSRGWLQDPAGNWVKDGNAEFDSDEEEPPPLPPA